MVVQTPAPLNASWLLLLGGARHYGWGLTDPSMQRFVWNISGSVVIVTFLWTFWQWRGARPIIIWWTVEEAQVIACSLGRMLRWWDVTQGQAQCSTLLGFDLGAAGLFSVALILAHGYVRTYRSQKKEETP